MNLWAALVDYQRIYIHLSRFPVKGKMEPLRNQFLEHPSEFLSRRWAVGATLDIVFIRIEPIGSSGDLMRTQSMSFENQVFQCHIAPANSFGLEGQSGWRAVFPEYPTASFDRRHRKCYLRGLWQ